MLKNVLKIVFLGVVGFSLLVYLTAPKNSNNKVENQNLQMNTSSFPKFFDVISSNSGINYQNIFAKNKEKYLVVLNHDSLIVFKDLSKFTSREDIVLLANISNTPWLIKELAVDKKLEEFFKNSKIPLVVDNGDFIRVLNNKDITQNKYFVYKISKNGEISKLFTEEVKFDALQKGIKEKEIENSIKYFLEKIS